MNSRAELAALRRQRLIAEIRMQRADLAAQMRPMMRSVESVGVGLRVANRIRMHPGWVAGLAAGILMITPRRLSSLLRFGSHSLRTWRAVSPTLQMLLRR